MVKDKYEKILNNFESRYPHFYGQAIDWWATGRRSIAIKLDDGTIIDYDDAANTLRWVKDVEDMDDEASRKAFGSNLQKFVAFSGMNKNEIAEKLGISTVMLSRYLHGKAMPSVEKARQLALLMGCTMEEFFDETYME